MTTNSAKLRSRRRVAAAASASWLALVAATTLGIGELGHLRAEVSASQAGELEAGSMRLIVQSYATGSLNAGRPPANVRPLASTQRAVTAEQLRDGIAVDILQLDDLTDADTTLIAWIEPGHPDLEFDALTARPSEHAVFGSAVTGGNRTRIVLNRRG